MADERKKSTRKPAAKKTAKKTTARAANKPAARKKPATQGPASIDDILAAQDDDERDEAREDPGDAGARGARPLAVGPSYLDDDADDDDDLLSRPAAEPGEDRPEPDALERAFDQHAVAPLLDAGGVDEVERPLYETLVGVLGALLAISVFFPWYEGAGFTASGWSSGAWGPVVFGLGLLAAATVALRRANVPLRFPVHHALLLEGLGWASVVLLLVKLNFAPRPTGAELPVTWWLRGSLVLALLLALVGGSVSQGVAIVIRPGWFRDTAGKLGAGLLVAAIAVGAVFGLLNDAAPPGFAGGPAAPSFKPGYPECATTIGFPKPNGVDAISGAPQQGFCIAQLETSLSQRQAINRYDRALRDAGWSIVYDAREDEQNPLGQLQAQKGQDCGSVTIARPTGDAGSTRVTIIIGPPEVACNLAEKLRIQRGETTTGQ